MNNDWHSVKNGIFMSLLGPAYVEGQTPPCAWKICLTATDEAYLLNLLTEISERIDCWAVKYTPKASPRSRDGMMLGRIWLTNQKATGELWDELYSDKKLMCNLQDDLAVSDFRRN